MMRQLSRCNVWLRDELIAHPNGTFSCDFCRTEKRNKKRYRVVTPSLEVFFQMLSLRVVIIFVLFVLIKAENKNGSYIRGEKVNPAYRIVSGNNHVDPKNEILEFQTVKRLSGSKPAWFWVPYKNKTQILGATKRSATPQQVPIETLPPQQESSCCLTCLHFMHPCLLHANHAGSSIV